MPAHKIKQVPGWIAGTSAAVIDAALAYNMLNIMFTRLGLSPTPSNLLTGYCAGGVLAEGVATEALAAGRECEALINKYLQRFTSRQQANHLVPTPLALVAQTPRRTRHSFAKLAWIPIAVIAGGYIVGISALAFYEIVTFLQSITMQVFLDPIKNWQMAIGIFAATVDVLGHVAFELEEFYLLLDKLIVGLAAAIATGAIHLYKKIQYGRADAEEHLSLLAPSSTTTHEEPSYPWKIVLAGHLLATFGSIGVNLAIANDLQHLLEAAHLRADVASALAYTVCIFAALNFNGKYAAEAKDSISQIAAQPRECARQFYQSSKFILPPLLALSSAISFFVINFESLRITVIELYEKNNTEPAPISVERAAALGGLIIGGLAFILRVAVQGKYVMQVVPKIMDTVWQASKKLGGFCYPLRGAAEIAPPVEESAPVLRIE